nr:hypothetical protein [uncultured Anaeromusa sp.]
MARLEYRLLDEEKDYPVLYTYEGLSQGEVTARFICDRFVKEGKAYERTSCALEPDGFVIYIQPAANGRVLWSAVEKKTAGLPLEIAACGSGLLSAQRQLVLSFLTYEEIHLQLLADYRMHQGEEWLKVSAELDEDRSVYVYYMEKVKEGA